MAAFLFPMLSANVAYGGIMPSLEIGCCTTEEKGGQCVDCPNGETCVTSNFFCDDAGGFFSQGACSEDGGGATCQSAISREGCCVVQPGSCVDNLGVETCLFGNDGGAGLWVSGQQCAAVPQCTLTRNIPTLSNWALIVTAGILVLVGIWGITRKKAEA